MNYFLFIISIISPYVYLASFIAVAIINLIAVKKGNNKVFNTTKPVLTILLCLYIVFNVGRYYDGSIVIVIVTAMLHYCIGDIMLMQKEKGWFIGGGISFFTGHVFLTFAFSRVSWFESTANYKNFYYYFAVPFAIFLAAVIGVIFIRIYKNVSKVMLPLTVLYLIALALMNVLAFRYMYRSIFYHYPMWIRGSVIAFIGALSFFVSDCLLLLSQYDEKLKNRIKSDFPVMLTYICGIFMITVGIVPVF